MTVIEQIQTLRAVISSRVANSKSGPWVYFGIFRDIVVALYILNHLSRTFLYIRGYGIFGSTSRALFELKKRFFRLLLALPPFKSKVDMELLQTVKKIEHELMKNSSQLLQFAALPDAGLQNAVILSELDNLNKLKGTSWKDGRVSGAVYHGGDELLELQTQAYQKYSVANQLHPDVFPGVRKMESEVVSMVLGIFNAPSQGCGSTTSGGTESLLLAGLAAREYGKLKKGISRPEIIAPVTVHAGIEKACYYFGMKLHKVDLDPKTYQVDIKKVRRLINGNTVLLVGSAPNFPHGIIDDIEALSKLGVKYNIPVHVDACLGSFIVTFLEASKVHGDAKLPLFDFRLPGVTSISCDTHKYGFAPKGSSVIMYRSSELRQCQYYVSSDWTGGMYGSPTLAGSRPGALMVGCWATLVNIGRNGYTQYCREIVGASMKLKHAIQTHSVLSQHLDVIGDPIGSVVAFKVKDDSKNILNIYELGDSLTRKGWHFSSLQNPSALHFAFTRLSVPVVDEMIEDISLSMAELIGKSSKNGADANKSDTAVLYGVAGSVKTTGVADKVIVAFLDTLYKV